MRLANKGERAYRPEHYGETITVVRTVTNSSSTYKLKGHNGQVVVEKKVKEELDRVLLSFNIQVDNPIAVLNQDTAKTFLFKCEPDKLYTFFMKATQLETCKHDYNAAAVEKGVAENHLVEKKNSLPELKKELGKWQKKYDFHQSLNVRKKDVRRKQGELAWALVKEVEVEAAEADRVADGERKKLPACEKKIGEKVEQEKKLREEKKEIETEIQDMAATNGDLKARVERNKGEKDTKEEDARNAKKVVKKLERKKENDANETKQLRDEIARLRETASEYEENSRARRREVEGLEEQVVALNSQVATTSTQAQHLKHNEGEAERGVQAAQGELVRLRGAVGRTRGELQDLGKAGSSKLAAFGRDMPRIVAEVEKAGRSFRKPPIGPLGAHVEVREDLGAEGTRLARAVEQELGGLVNAFLCDNSADQRTLYNLFTKLGLRNKPTIFTCSFTENRHNVEATKVRSEKYPTLIDCVTIADTNVFNRAVDSAALERILAIPTEAEAQALLSSVAMVPRGLAHAHVPNYQYFPAPNYRSYYRQDRTQGVLRASVEELIGAKKQQLVGEEQEAAAGEARVREAQAERKRFSDMVRVEEVKVAKIRGEVRRVNGLVTELRNQEEAEQPVDIAALEDDLQVKAEELETAEVAIQEKRARAAEVEEELEVARGRYRETSEEYEAKMEGLGPLNARLELVEAGIPKARKEKEHYESKMAAYQARHAEAAAVAGEKATAVEAAVVRARELSEERLETTRKVKSLTIEIAKMQESLKRQEETQESREVVTTEYLRLKSVFDKAEHQVGLGFMLFGFVLNIIVGISFGFLCFICLCLQVKTMANTVSYLEDMLQKRKKGFRTILQTTSKNIQTNFTVQLNARDYLGRLDFNHKQNTLTIVVNPDSKANAAALDIERDIRSLSGGEKSYSSVSLILALWNAMTPPFRVLDEVSRVHDEGYRVKGEGVGYMCRRWPPPKVNPLLAVRRVHGRGQQEGLPHQHHQQRAGRAQVPPPHAQQHHSRPPPQVPVHLPHPPQHGRDRGGRRLQDRQAVEEAGLGHAAHDGRLDPAVHEGCLGQVGHLSICLNSIFISEHFCRVIQCKSINAESCQVSQI